MRSNDLIRQACYAIAPGGTPLASTSDGKPLLPMQQQSQRGIVVALREAWDGTVAGEVTVTSEKFASTRDLEQLVLDMQASLVDRRDRLDRALGLVPRSELEAELARLRRAPEGEGR